MMDHLPSLKDVRILDASRVLAGPFCAQVLGDLGADVIKVERPVSGDETRSWGPPFLGDLSAYFLSCNRNKRSITLDLASEKGGEILQDLLTHCDVLLENFRPQSLERLGLTGEKLHQKHPKLIICSISGFGRTSPWKDRPGYDVAIQALSGMMNITGPVEGPPSKVGVAVTDVLTGLYAVIAILACLHAREKSGHGYSVDLSLLDCAVASQVNVAQAYLSSGDVPPRQGNAHLQIVPYQLFQTADGWIILAVGNDGQWQKFCRVAERADLASDERFLTNPGRVQNRETLVPMLEDVMRSRSTEQWQQGLEKETVPYAPVWDYEQLFSSEYAKQRGLSVQVKDPQGNPVDLIGSPFHFGDGTVPTPQVPPELSQHTEEILENLLGYQANQIEELRQQQII